MRVGDYYRNGGKMTRPSIQIEGQIADPYFCETESDFHKLCLAECRAYTDNGEDAQIFMTGLKIMLHEYLALVLSQKIKPYEMERRWVKDEMDGFKATINYMNELFTKIGLPVYEGENGKIEIDYEQIKKDVGENEQK